MNTGSGSEQIEGEEQQPDEPRTKSNAELVEKAIQAFSKTLFSQKGVTVTVAEFIRLLEVQKQIGGDRPKEIKVTWVDPVEMKSS